MNVLVVSPHPDDETLGCGGTLLKLKKNNNLFWLNVTDMTEDYGFPFDKINARQKQITKINAFYGFTKMKNLKYMPAGLDKVNSSKAIQAISSFIDEVSANFVFLPDANDAHSDHKIVFDWCFSSTKVFRHPTVKTIMTMEILSETNFNRGGGGYLTLIIMLIYQPP